MGICEIGEKKINGKRYVKRPAVVVWSCKGCSVASSPDGCHLYAKTCSTHLAIEDGGAECFGTIWVACDPPKPAKKLAKWTPRTIKIPAKTTRAVLVDLVHECVAEINQLGTENAKLKNQIAKGKAK